MCDICVTGKMRTLPFKSHFVETFKPLDCLHLDIVAPISPPSISGHLYFLTIVDQFTSFKITRFLKNKSNAYEEFVNQQNFMENLHDRKIKMITTDGGGEFLNQKFKELANNKGFKHNVAPPYTPEHNGIAKRANRTILDKARCLLIGSKLPHQYWDKAVNTATYLSNILPTPSRNNLSPHYMWNKRPPKIKNIRTFGCKVIFSVPKQKHAWKLAPVGEVGILLGFSNESSYRILKLKDSKVYNKEYFDCQEFLDKEEVQDDQETGNNQSNDNSDHTDAEDEEQSDPESNHHPTAKRIRVIGP
ncbi:hypothetical protein O181_088635 [Austropuccinia psidii MF-1]|uniref:Integrase catalytic domain-containing protein n=1 Tax=Austropuccinia psidii MF-1 TaxID=1389203 RepID=A0A9Q3IS99_9BASI|nr:hypothetical protein [Austropuccinia psidii MF-1]